MSVVVKSPQYAFAGPKTDYRRHNTGNDLDTYSLGRIDPSVPPLDTDQFGREASPLELSEGTIIHSFNANLAFHLQCREAFHSIQGGHYSSAQESLELSDRAAVECFADEWVQSRDKLLSSSEVMEIAQVTEEQLRHEKFEARAYYQMGELIQQSFLEISRRLDNDYNPPSQLFQWLKDQFYCSMRRTLDIDRNSNDLSGRWLGRNAISLDTPLYSEDGPSLAEMASRGPSSNVRLISGLISSPSVPEEHSSLPALEKLHRYFVLSHFTTGNNGPITSDLDLSRLDPSTISQIRKKLLLTEEELQHAEDTVEAFLANKLSASSLDGFSRFILISTACYRLGKLPQDVNASDIMDLSCWANTTLKSNIQQLFNADGKFSGLPFPTDCLQVEYDLVVNRQKAILKSAHFKSDFLSALLPEVCAELIGKLAEQVGKLPGDLTSEDIIQPLVEYRFPVTKIIQGCNIDDQVTNLDIIQHFIEQHDVPTDRTRIIARQIEILTASPRSVESLPSSSWLPETRSEIILLLCEECGKLPQHLTPSDLRTSQGVGRTISSLITSGESSSAGVTAKTLATFIASNSIHLNIDREKLRARQIEVFINSPQPPVGFANYALPETKATLVVMISEQIGKLPLDLNVNDFSIKLTKGQNPIKCLIASPRGIACINRLKTLKDQIDFHHLPVDRDKILARQIERFANHEPIGWEGTSYEFRRYVIGKLAESIGKLPHQLTTLDYQQTIPEFGRGIRQLLVLYQKREQCVPHLALLKINRELATSSIPVNLLLIQQRQLEILTTSDRIPSTLLVDTVVTLVTHLCEDLGKLPEQLGITDFKSSKNRYGRSLRFLLSRYSPSEAPSNDTVSALLTKLKELGIQPDRARIRESQLKMVANGMRLPDPPLRDTMETLLAHLAEDSGKLPEQLLSADLRNTNNRYKRRLAFLFAPYLSGEVSDKTIISQLISSFNLADIVVDRARVVSKQLEIIANNHRLPRNLLPETRNTLLAHLCEDLGKLPHQLNLKDFRSNKNRYRTCMTLLLPDGFQTTLTHQRNAEDDGSPSANSEIPTKSQLKFFLDTLDTSTIPVDESKVVKTQLRIFKNSREVPGAFRSLAHRETKRSLIAKLCYTLGCYPKALKAHSLSADVHPYGKNMRWMLPPNNGKTQQALWQELYQELDLDSLVLNNRRISNKQLQVHIRSKRIEWDKVDLRGKQFVIGCLAEEVGRLPEQLTTSDYQRKIAKIGRGIETLLRSYQIRHQCNPAEALSYLNEEIGTATIPVNKQKIFRKQFSQLRSSTHLKAFWPYALPETRLAAVRLLCKAINKPMLDLTTPDFSKPIQQLGGKTLEGLLMYYERVYNCPSKAALANAKNNDLAKLVEQL